MAEGFSSEGTNVRTRWQDGTEANYISIVGVSNVYNVEKEFPMITLRTVSYTHLAWHTYLFEDRCVPFLQFFARKDVSLPCKELYTINYKTIDLN